MKSTTVVLSLLLSVVLFYVIGAFACWNLNPQQWPIELRGVTALGAVLFWYHDISKPE